MTTNTSATVWHPYLILLLTCHYVAQCQVQKPSYLHPGNVIQTTVKHDKQYMQQELMLQ